MKLLFCIDQYRPSRGGAETYLRDLSAALHDRGHAISIATLVAEEDGHSEIVTIDAPPFPRLAREIVFASKVKRLARSNAFDRSLGFRHTLDADLFQPHEGLFLDAVQGSTRPASPSRLVQNLLFMKKWISMKNLFFFHADRALFKNRPGLKVAALSNRIAAIIRDRFARYHPKVTVIPNGVDLQKYYPEPDLDRRAVLRRKLDLPESGKLLLFVGHNFRLKGLKEAIKGLNEYSGRCREKPLLLVVGRGRQGPYKKQAQALGLTDQVRFLGDRAEMRDLYVASDVLLHPTFYDPCSLVVLEALGCGLPVITSRYNGASELIEGTEAGRILDDPRDCAAMARALSIILESHSFPSICNHAAALGAANSFEKHVDRMEAWITTT